MSKEMGRKRNIYPHPWPFRRERGDGESKKNDPEYEIRGFSCFFIGNQTLTPKIALRNGKQPDGLASIAAIQVHR